MVFSSGIFLYLFLPVFLGCYYLTPWRFKSYAILLGSYVFYAWWRVDYLALVILISLWSYAASLLIQHARSGKMAKTGLILGVGGDLLSLAYFKYFNFFTDNINSVLTATGQTPITFWDVILPIGISFHVFQSVSYVIDVYRKDTPPSRNVIDFLAFSSLFPQLIAGPVLRYKDLAEQFVSRTHSWELFNEGCRRFALGFVSKVLIADTIAPLVTLAFDQSSPSLALSWLGALAYTAQLYFDFSAYSHMAIGIGLMMGFRFIENFNAPYISRSITEFWRRWHISLSTWLRDYLYIPLGGNRKGAVRTYINLLLTMVLGGFWHGANWTFVIWGMWHGGIMAIERFVADRRQTGQKNAAARLKAVSLGLVPTFLLVVVGWVMFRATSVHGAFDMYAGMLGFNGIGPEPQLWWQVERFQLMTLAIAYFLMFAGPMLSAYCLTRLSRVSLKVASIALPVLFVLAALKLSAQNYSPFLYFQF